MTTVALEKQIPTMMADSTLAALSTPNNTVIVENRFGSLLFTPMQIFQFHTGIVGFSQYHEFGLCRFPHQTDTHKFQLLQSLEEASLSFIVFPTTFDTALIDQTDALLLAAEYAIAPNALLILHIATVRMINDTPSISINLRAPVLLDIHQQKGIQHVFTNKQYSLQHTDISSF
jgi:flagellar assembly factor FliW